MFRKTKYFADAVIDWVDGNAMPTAPTALTLHAFTTAPTDDAMTGAVECSYSNYAGVSFQGLLGTKSGTNVTSIRNNANGDDNDKITFGEVALGVDSTQRIEAWAVKHNNGQYLYWARQNPTLVVREGQSPEISTGNLIITEE